MRTFKDTYFVIYGIISEFTDKRNFTSLPGQFQYLTLLRGLQGGLTCNLIRFYPQLRSYPSAIILLEGDFVSQSK